MQNPKKQVIIKFIILCVILLCYFLYLTYKYNFLTGGVTALLTWSFFVLCTPIADAGFILDFPLRVLFGIRMVMSEMVVWAIAITINIGSLLYFREYYQTTALTKIFEAILTHPFPYWAVIILSGIGTFLSIKFGDELMDVIHHKERDYFHSHHFKLELIMILFFAFIVIAYYELIASLGIKIAG